jgi:hypothetical protein
LSRSRATDAERGAVADKLRSLPSVKDVAFISKR